MKPLFAALLACAPAFATISGTVMNGTTRQPQPGITVSLLKMSATGPEDAGDGKADAQGKFTLNAEANAQGPTLVRATMDGVTYTKLIPPGTPTEGLTLEVFQASKQPGTAKVSKHLIFFEPTAQGLSINETYLFVNDGNTTWNDPAGGTLQFYLPKGANGKVRIGATAPGGMPLQESAVATGKPDIYKVNFPVRPGETRFDLTYSTPYTEGAPFDAKVVTKDDNTYLIVPKGVTLKGDNLNDMGQEPRTEAHIFGLRDAAYNIALTGQVEPASNNPDAGDDSGSQDQGSQITEVMPRLYNQQTAILAIALDILALGFVLLYRTSNSSPPPKETNERGRG